MTGIQFYIGNVDVNYRIVFRGLTILSPMSMTVTLAYVKSHQHDVTNVGYVMSTCLKTMFAIIVHSAVNVSEINFVGSEPEKLPLGLRKFRIETRFWLTRSFRNFQRHLYNQRLLQHIMQAAPVPSSWNPFKLQLRSNANSTTSANWLFLETLVFYFENTPVTFRQDIWAMHVEISIFM